MKPVNPDKTPASLAHAKGGRTGLIHGPAPMLPRAFTRAHPDRNKTGRKGAKARARMLRVLERRYGIRKGRLDVPVVR
jgi:hypothetical protein